MKLPGLNDAILQGCQRVMPGCLGMLSAILMALLAIFYGIASR
jgi:hypothetical protein